MTTSSMRDRICIAGAVLLVTTGVSASAVMTGWNVGWNDMAEVSGGSVTPVLSPIGNLQYMNVAGANVSFSTADFFNGFFAPGGYSWADASGDQGQHFFDGAIRNSWYDGLVQETSAADWNGVGPTGDYAGDYEWLVNNYSRDGQGNPANLRNSWIRGTDSSFTYDEQTGQFVADMVSDGTWYWYTPTTPDSPMSGWIQNWDWSWDTNGVFADYYDRYMTGNFRLVGSFSEEAGLPILTSATLQYEVAQATASVPDGGITMLLLGLGLAPLALFRRRR